MMEGLTSWVPDLHGSRGKIDGKARGKGEGSGSEHTPREEHDEHCYGVTPWGGPIFHESLRESRISGGRGKGDEIHEHTHTKNPTNSRTQNTIHADNSRRWQ